MNLKALIITAQSISLSDDFRPKSITKKGERTQSESMSTIIYFLVDNKNILLLIFL